MKKIAKAFSVILVSLCAFFILGTTCFAASVDTAYTTKNYNVDVKLSEKNVYSVVESIDTYFKLSRHGIYRNIPYKGFISFKDKDGNVTEQKYRASINNIKTYGDPKDISTENGNKVIKIGDGDTYVKGDKSYKISYSLNAKDDKNKNQDIIYINVLPTSWRTDIDNATFSVTFPKAIDTSKLKLFVGRYGEEEEANFLSKEFNKNNLPDNTEIKIDNMTETSISGTIKNLPSNCGVTVYALVDEGYFVGATNDMGWLVLLWTILLAIPVLAIILYLIFGRDEPIVEVVSFKPPQGITSAEVGYVMDNIVDNKDLISLIIYWADHGYLRIHENDNSFVLERINYLPPNADKYEHTMFNGLFKSGEMVDIKDLQGEYYSKITKAKSELQYKYRNGALYTPQSMKVKAFCKFMILIVMFLGIALPAYLSIADTAAYIGAAVATLAFGVAAYSITDLAQRWFNCTAAYKTGKFITACIAFAISIFTGFITSNAIIYQTGYVNGLYSEKILNTTYLIPIIIAYIGGIILTGIACVAPKRTQYLNELLGSLFGLKNFIKVAEKDRLEMLVKEDPQVFYHILPYAYVMGVSDTWCKNFEGLAVEPPNWYCGNPYTYPYVNTMVFMHSINHCMSSATSNLAVPPASTSSGGGFSSGGGGGGGFSGGGFGGGGGGSW